MFFYISKLAILYKLVTFFFIFICRSDGISGACMANSLLPRPILFGAHSDSNNNAALKNRTQSRYHRSSSVDSPYRHRGHNLSEFDSGHGRRADAVNCRIDNRGHLQNQTNQERISDFGEGEHCDNNNLTRISETSSSERDQARENLNELLDLLLVSASRCVSSTANNRVHQSAGKDRSPCECKSSTSHLQHHLLSPSSSEDNNNLLLNCRRDDSIYRTPILANGDSCYFQSNTGPSGSFQGRRDLFPILPQLPATADNFGVPRAFGSGGQDTLRPTNTQSDCRAPVRSLPNKNQPVPLNTSSADDTATGLSLHGGVLRPAHPVHHSSTVTATNLSLALHNNMASSSSEALLHERSSSFSFSSNSSLCGEEEEGREGGSQGDLHSGGSPISSQVYFSLFWCGLFIFVECLACLSH